MKLTFLGTSAGEEYPGIWCRCENCEKAREWGGKNIRRNSSVVIDEDIMIDFGKTAHIQAERFGIDIGKVKTLLVTHSHKDHFDTHNLWARQMTEGYDKLPFDEQKKLSSPRFSALPQLQVLGSSQVAKALSSHFDYENPFAQMNFKIIEPFQNYSIDGAEIFTLDGRHSDGDIHAVNYIITRKNITFLYLSDSGFPFDITLESLMKYKYDFIITEGTFGFGIDSSAHMGFDKNVRILEFFNEKQLWKDNPDYYVTHVSPHWCPPHDEYSPVLAEKGITLAYDGLTIEYPYN